MQGSHMMDCYIRQKMVITNCHIKVDNRSNIKTPIENLSKRALKFKKTKIKDLLAYS